MQVLTHSPAPATPAVGVWWLPKHQSQPQSEYIDQKYYRHGALNIFGDGGAHIFTLAEWEEQVRHLTESTSPLGSWQSYETSKKPLDFLVSLL